jgi:hypothetical protein
MVMGGDGNGSLELSASFATLSGAESLRQLMGATPAGSSIVELGRRHTPTVDASMFLIWALGCFVAGFAAWRSAAVERFVRFLPLLFASGRCLLVLCLLLVTHVRSHGVLVLTHVLQSLINLVTVHLIAEYLSSRPVRTVYLGDQNMLENASHCRKRDSRMLLWRRERRTLLAGCSRRARRSHTLAAAPSL